MRRINLKYWPWKMSITYRYLLTRVTKYIPKSLLKIDNAHDLLNKIDSSAFLAVWFVHPLNGQLNRQLTMSNIALAYKPEIVIETGTYVGSSTPYLASLASDQTITIESQEKFLVQAKKHFIHLGQFAEKISVIHGDSSVELKKVLSQIPCGNKVLFYLDAHLDSVLPLKEELELIINWGGSFIVVIDDFQIPDDSSFGYDHYEGEAINLGLIPNTFKGELWLPNHTADFESGGRKGTAYLFSELALSEIEVSKVFGIRHYRNWS